MSTARADNLPPEIPVVRYPLDGATRVGITAAIGWEGLDPEGKTLKYDVYWGPVSNPPLVAINEPNYYLNQAYYSPNLHGYAHTYSTTYYWRVVARDDLGAETSGPTWSYTTKAANEPPDAPEAVWPAVGETGVPVNPTLRFQGKDQEAVYASNYDVYLGTDADPPLVASHVMGFSFQPAVLTPNTLYYWRLVARDYGGLTTSGPTWTFTTANTSNQIPSIPSNPVPGSYNPDASTTLVISWSCSDPDGDELTYKVYLSSIWPDDRHPLPLVGTTTERELEVQLEPNKRYYWYVEATDGMWTVKSLRWQFDNGSVPVLFSRFDARLAGDDVEVRWELVSDEAMESYALYRREDKATSAVVVANAPVHGNEGSYVDTSVEPGKTYHYEVLIRTTEGDEFRSQVATVSMPSRTLTLHPNVPNPFNPQTTIRYEIPTAARVQLAIFDVAGRRVRTLVDENQQPGSREVVWTGRDDAGVSISSGIYFYVLDVDGRRITRKMALLK